MTAKLLGGGYRKARDVFHVAQVGIIVGVLYVMALAPYCVLNGQAESPLDHVAGLAGILIWAFVLVNFAEALP